MHSSRYARSLIAVTALIGSATLVLAGCAGTDAPEGSATSGDLDVRVYGDWPFVETYAQAFMDEHPDANISVGGVTNDELRQSGGRTFLSDESPDIVSYTLGQEQMEAWIAAGALLPLDDVWESGDLASVHADSYIDIATASDGKKYSVPLGLTVLPFLYYNTQAWTDAGAAAPDPATHSWASMDDFETALDSLVDAGVTPIATAGGSLMSIPFASLLATSCGVDTYLEISGNWRAGQEDARAYTEQCAVDAIAKLGAWADAGYYPDGIQTLEYDQSTALFETGKAASWLQGSWAPPVYTPPFDWSWSVIPPMTDDEPATLGVALDSFLVPAGSKNPELAKAFIAFMVEKSTLELGMGRIPARDDVDLAKVIPDTPMEVELSDYLATAQTVPIWDTIVPTVLLDTWVQVVANGVMTGQLTAEEAAEQLQAAAEEYRSQQE